MISPAISFPGTCEQAIALYEKAFHATDVFKDYYDSAPKDSGLNEKGDLCGKIMYAGITICGTMLNMSDSETPVPPESNIKLNVYMESGDAVTQAFEILKDGGIVKVPLGPQFFSPLYAAVVDQYGVYWQLIS